MSTPTRTALVAGGSGGIGRAVVARLRADGFRVLNLDRVPFADAGAGIETITVDIADEASIANAFGEVDARLGGASPDVLVTLAAVSTAAHFLDVATGDLDHMLAVNVRGTFLLCQAAAKRMRNARRGHIVVITSVASAQAWAGEMIYCATKAAQMSLVQGMAVELAPFGIMVNAVGPGIIDVKSKGMAGTRADEAVYRHDIERTPLGRFGAPEEIAEAILFLTKSTWMTGQTIYVDGGFLANGLAYFGERQKRLVESDPK
jgi:NAD(P)-dependent dehydrogenase (short-subunit alcohol dehydrogenase family)